MSNMGRFLPWLEKTRASFPITRVAYRALETIRIVQLIQAAEHDLAHAHTQDDHSEAEFALQELRAVLAERSGERSATVGA